MSAINALFVRYLWRDERNGESLFVVKTRRKLPLEQMYTSMNKDGEDTWYSITCSGSIPYYNINTPVAIDGRYINVRHNEKYKAWTFEVTSIEEESADGYTTHLFLDSLNIDKDMQEWIEGKVGDDDLFGKLKDDSFRKELRKECDRKEADRLIKTVDRTTEERELFLWLSRFGISYSMCAKAAKKWGRDARKKILQNPYSAGKCLGYSLWTADGIYRSEGHAATERNRLRALFKATLEKMINLGGDFVAPDLFVKLANKISQSASYYEKIPASVIGNIDSDIGKAIKIKNSLYIADAELLAAEERIIKNLGRFSGIRKTEAFSEKLIDYAEKKCGMKYGGQQRMAFESLLSKKGIKILTGGPGTGKTTTLKGVLYAYMKMHPHDKIRLCAPTGRAAQRMSESTGMPATTVHRLLEYAPYGEGATHKDASDPIDADLIVVDETSMLDIFLFDMLIDAVKTGASIFLIGDTNQLEPVGPGAILRDLMQLEFIEKANLTEVFRQKGGSPIIENSVRIQNGRTQMMLHEDFNIINTHDEEESKEAVIKLMKELYDEKDPFKTQILCPARKGAAGIENLNTMLQNILNPKDEEIIYGKLHFRVNDKILMVRNNYELDYYNGDVGIVKSVKGGKLIVDIRGEDKEIGRDLMSDIVLAYGMTIHKSQGSEFENVIISLTRSANNMLVRNLFYTGVTRAKKRIWIINENDAVRDSILNKGVHRKTLMKDLLSNNVKIVR